MWIYTPPKRPEAGGSHLALAAMKPARVWLTCFWIARRLFREPLDARKIATLYYAIVICDKTD